MLPSVRQLSVRLHRARRVNQVVRLSRKEVDLLLAALRTIERTQIDRGHRTEGFQIELLDAYGWAIEALAAFTDETLARAVFAHAVKMRSDWKMRLRFGSRILANESL
jgi:hypothetical protein